MTARPPPVHSNCGFTANCPSLIISSVPPNGLFGAGVALHEARHRPAVGGHRVLQSVRLEDALLQLLVVRRSAGPLDDHAEDDVVGVGVFPALARRERRLRVEQIGEPVLAGVQTLSGLAVRSAVNFGFSS